LCADRAEYFFHEGAASQDTLIGHSVLARSAKVVHFLPSSHAAAQPAALQLWASTPYDSFGHVLTITASCNPRVFVKSAQYLTDSLPRARNTAHESTMTGPRVSVQRIQINDGFDAKRVCMDVPYKLQQVWFFLHEDGFVPILEKVAAAFVASIECPGVSRQEASHGRRQGSFPGSDQ